MKTSKPTMDLNRPLSWSSISCFDDKDWGNPEKWYTQYVLGIREKPSRELLFGSMIDKQLQNDTEFLPDLERLPYLQYKLEAEYKGIKLLGYPDGWDPDSTPKRMNDFKTGKNAWTQKKADETGQLTMYATILYLSEGIKPEEIDFQIDWMETVQNADLSIGFVKNMKVKTFHTKRTMADVLKFLSRIEKTRKAMIEYCKKHK